MLVAFFNDRYGMQLYRAGYKYKELVSTFFFQFERTGGSELSPCLSFPFQTSCLFNLVEGDLHQ